MAMVFDNPQARAATLARGPDLYQQVPKALVLAFLSFLIFRYLEGGDRIAFLGRIRFELLVGSVLSVAGVVIYLRDKQRASTAPLRWGLALAAWMLVMVALSVDPALSWKIFFDRVLKFLMIAIFIAAFVTTPQVLRWFLIAYLLAFAKMVQEGIHGLLTGSLVWQNQGVDRLHGPTISYAHPNSFSGTQLGTLPYLYKLFPLVRANWLRVAIVAQGIGAAVIILYCGSRTAYVATLLWLAISILGAKSRGKAIAIALVVTIATIPFIPQQYYARFETMFTQQEIEGASIDTRKEILRDAWQVFLEHPMGIGVGAFPSIRAKEFGRAQDTHNLYLEVATNLGVVGFVLFIGMVMSTLGTLRRVGKELGAQSEALRALPASEAIEAHARDLAIMQATAGATFQFLIIRLALGLFGHDMYEVYWWFAIGIAIALSRMAATATAVSTKLGVKPRVARKGATA